MIFVAIPACLLPALCGHWNERLETAGGRGARPIRWRDLDHPEQGRLSLDEVRKIMAHEIEHHAADLTLIVSA